MGDKELSALKALAEAATPQNFDSAAIKREGGYMDCPTCGGEGAVDVTTDYCNYDGVAIGAAFYGIGPEHLTAEKYYRAANPAAILSLISRVEQQAARIAELESQQLAGAAKGGNTSADLSGLTRYDRMLSGMVEKSLGEYVKLTDVQAILAAPARDVGGLTDERICALWEKAIAQFQRHEAGVSIHPSLYLSRAIEREVLATKEAEPVQAEVRNAALEEAANLCETAEIPFDISVWHSTTKQGISGKTALALADAIRALKTQPATSPAPSVKQEASEHPLRAALVTAEAALADIGDADREPGDDLAWCEARAVKALPEVRAALAAPSASQGEANGWKHAANEWADSAYAGLQWLRNIEDGTTTDIKRARENMEQCCAHARQVFDALSIKASAAPSVMDGE